MVVSIGIPFLNPGPAFEGAVRSVFAQSHADWELLLVDDGSSDGSLERARAIVDPRVRVLSDGVNRGLVSRLNEIARQARHDLLCRMDADDVMHPERLRRQLEAMEGGPEVDVVGTLAVTIDPENRLGGLLGRAFAATPGPAQALAASVFVHPSVMGRRRWFLENPYDEAFVRAEDQELWCRAAARSTYRVLDEPLLFYRQPARINVRSYSRSCRTVRKIFKQYGPSLVGAGGTARLVAGSLVKEAGHLLAHALGADRALLRCWARALPEPLREPSRAGLQRALSARVPGWDR